MFGKRSTTGGAPSAPSQAAAPAQGDSGCPAAGGSPAPEPQRATAPAPEPPEPIAVDAPAPKSDKYYDTKSMVFGALIEAIDLSQLAKLDVESAREEIRDIVNEIIGIKNIVMSISEQEELLEDICNDVLGYGPLEPLLAATTSPTSWSTAPPRPTSKSAARSS